jgi:hypothetical protein
MLSVKAGLCAMEIAGLHRSTMIILSIFRLRLES